MTRNRLSLFLAVPVVLVLGIGLILDADGLVLVICGALTAAALLRGVMGGEGAAPHSIR